MEFITQFFSDTALYALGWTVVHSLWQGTLLAVLLSVLMMALEKRSARLRYEVACGAMFTMLMMALATFIIYLDQDPNAVEVTVALMGGNSNSSLTIINGETSFLQSNFQTVIAFFDAQLPLIVNVWLIGFLFFAFRMTGGFIHLRQLRHQDNFPADKMLQGKLNQLIRRSPLQRSVKVMESALIKVPILLGHLKPLILIPVGTINLLTEEEVEAILAHELAHIIRRDFSMNIFFTLIEILFYYHPGVWLMAATIRSEREHCCDDLALFLCKKPLAYARALYKLEAAHKAARLPGLALSFSSQKNQLLHRVRRILNQPQNKSNIMEKLMATTFLLLTITILSVGATTPLDNLKTHRVISTSVEKLSHPVVYVEASRLPTINVLPRIVLDTIPVKRRDRRKIIKTENGRAIEITMEDGQISNLKIDGNEIPADQYDQHEDLIQDLVVEFENISPPPATPAPPTPPQIMADVPAPPAPPGAAPKAPTSPTKIKEISIDDETVIIYEDGSKMVVGDDEEVTEIQEVEMEIHQKEMEEHHKKMEVHHKKMEKHHKKMEEQREEMMEAHREKMEAHHEKMNAHREKMEIKRIEREERMEEIHESRGSVNKIIATDIGHSSNEINNAIVDQLIADGLIDSRENYKFELSGQKFKVNRKTQSDAIHQKYKQLYEELSGSPLSDKSKIKVAKSKF